MTNKIPRLHSWCSHCINPDNYYRKDGSPYCPNHLGPNGEPVEYTGSDAHQPSDWVLRVVGKRFTHCYWGKDDTCTRVSVCIGYDPRHGFWMKTTDDSDELPPYLSNVSEAAIGKTYHEVRPTLGSLELLMRTDELGRLPAEDEVEGIDLGMAKETLIRNGFLTRDDQITSEGREFLASDPSPV